MIFQILKLIENDLFEPERRISLPPKSETLNLWTQLISPKLWHFFLKQVQIIDKNTTDTSIAQQKTRGRPAFLKSQEYIASHEDSHQHGGGNTWWDGDFHQPATSLGIVGDNDGL